MLSKLETVNIQSFCFLFPRILILCSVSNYQELQILVIFTPIHVVLNSVVSRSCSSHKQPKNESLQFRQKINRVVSFNNFLGPFELFLNKIVYISHSNSSKVSSTQTVIPKKLYPYCMFMKELKNMLVQSYVIGNACVPWSKFQLLQLKSTEISTMIRIYTTFHSSLRSCDDSYSFCRQQLLITSPDEVAVKNIPCQLPNKLLCSR